MKAVVGLYDCMYILLLIRRYAQCIYEYVLRPQYK